MKIVSSSKPIAMLLVPMFFGLSKTINWFWGLSTFSARHRKFGLISGCLFKLIIALFMKEKREAVQESIAYVVVLVVLPPSSSSTNKKERQNRTKKKMKKRLFCRAQMEELKRKRDIRNKTDNFDTGTDEETLQYLDKKQRPKTDEEIVAELMQQQGYSLTSNQGYTPPGLEMPSLNNEP
jgi:hypothetical protein